MNTQNMITQTSVTEPKILYTSLKEIAAFKPCISGWKNICKACANTSEPELEETPISILQCVKVASISDVFWLLGKRKKEVQICVKFARMCADSVKQFKNDASASTYAYADAVYDAYAASISTSASASASASYAYDAYAASASASYASAASASYAYASDVDAYTSQVLKNKQLLIDCINQYQEGTL
jgi:hypothetical protein